MLFNVIVVSSLLWIITVHATPTGNHTCTGVVKHSVTVRVNVTEPVTYRTYTWCLRVPPRCSKYTVQLKDRVKIHTEMHNRTITVCCKGYVEMDYKCVPACPPQTECPNMHCNRTNHCYCTPGYQGLYCNYPCDRGFWGTDCKKPCDCPDGYTCHHLTGDCMLDDRPPLTTKFRRTTTTTVATISPETTITESTTSTTKPSTESPTQPDFSSTKENRAVHTTLPQSTTTQTTSLTTTVSTLEPTTQTVQKKIYKTSTFDQTSSSHSTNELPLTQLTSSTLNTNPSSAASLGQLPTTETVGMSSNTLFTKQYIVSTSVNLPTTTTELPIKKIPAVTTTTTSEGEVTQAVTSTLSSTLDLLDKVHSAVAVNVSEGSLLTSSILATTPSPVSVTPLIATTTTPTVSIPEATVNTVPSESSTRFTTSNAIPTTMSTTSTTPSTTSVEHSTVETTTPFYFSTTTFPIKTSSGIETTTNNISTITSFKITTLSKDETSDTKSTFDFNKTTIQTITSTTEEASGNEKKIKYIKIDVPFSEPTTATNTDATKISFPITETTSPTSTTSTEKLLESLPQIEHVVSTTVPASTAVTTRDVAATSDLLAKFTLKKFIEEVNTFYDSTTDSWNFREAEKQNEEIQESILTKVTPKIDITTETVKIDSTTMAYLESDSIITIPTTIAQPEINSKTSESTKTSAETSFPVTSGIDNSQIDFVTNYKTKNLPKVTTEKNFKVFNNDSVSIIEATENDKFDPSHRITNTMKKSYKNGTNLIYGLNEVSTKFGQPFFDLGKSVSEMKLKQRTEVTTTSTTKVDASTKNVWTTTNSRPAHTWYSHVKDYQKKIKNKEDTKLLKTTTNLESVVVTEKDDMSEESNIIDSMHTTYIDRGSKSNSGAPPIVNEEANIPSTYVQNGHFNYNLSGALAEEVQASRNDKSFFSLYTTSTLITGIALILLISTSTTLWLCLRRKKEPTTLRAPCIMAYGPPNEFTLNPLLYETVYPLGSLEEEQCDNPEIFFCPTFTNNYAEKINRELSELNYDHPRSSICEPLYAEIRY